jgi:hypothetical protein
METDLRDFREPFMTAKLAVQATPGSRADVELGDTRLPPSQVDTP